MNEPNEKQARIVRATKGKGMGFQATSSRRHSDTHRRNITYQIFIAISLLLTLTFFGCGGGEKKSDAKPVSTTIRIGSYASLTGTTAAFGRSSYNGLMLAVDEANAAGGVLGKQIQIFSEDTQSKPEEAVTAVSKLINRDHVCALIGEIASSRTLAAAPLAQEAKIPMVSPGSTNPEVTRKGDYIFRVCYIDPFQGEVMAKFAFNSLKMTKVAVLTDVKNDYSVGLGDFFKRTFSDLGGSIVGEQSYSEGDSDFRAQLTALKNSGMEGVFVPGYYTEAALICKQARELNIAIPFFGGDGWDANELYQIGGAAVEGSFFSNHYAPDDTTSQVQEFIAKYKARHNNEIPDAMAVLGYDAANVMIDAIKRAGSDNSEAIRNALAQTVNFPGVSGMTTIDAERNAQKPIVVVQVRDAQPRFFERVNP